MSLTLPYTLKRFIAQLLMPVPLVIEIFVLGWVVNRFTRFKRTGNSLKVLAGCLFLAFGYGLGGSYLMRIERQYPPFDPTPVECEEMRGLDVLVLGQGMAVESDLPIRYRVNATFNQRLFEGVRISRLIPDSRIIVSMAGDASLSDKEQFLDDYASTAGIPRSSMIMFGEARDTFEEVKMALGLARTNTLIVATSASHIPRALAIVRKAGAHPIPAPCDYTRASLARPEYSFSNLPLPSDRGFEESRQAAHEWLGSAYEEL